jgi:SAGA-associated factor 29
MGDNIEQFRRLKSKLTAASDEIRVASEQESKVISEALEHLSVLIALRSAPEAPLQEKRVKRLRMPSPSSNPSSPSPSFSNRPSTNVQTAKARFASQLPLQPGRKVAFRPSTAKQHDKGAHDADSEQWILAVVQRMLNNDKTRYEVQDMDDEDNKCFNTTIKWIIPLPDPKAPEGSPSHLSAYEYYPPGTVTLAVYPDTTAFYRAVVVTGYKDNIQPGSRTVPSQSKVPKYLLRFEEDDNQTRAVDAYLVIAHPEP